MIRRPLFLAAVLLVIAAALRLGTGGAAEPASSAERNVRHTSGCL